MSKKRKKKIIVAMSGGVDSSVAAALLKKRSFEVKGIYMRLFDAPDTSGERAARAVADKLEIKFKILDLRKEFKKRVIDCFLHDFKVGKTPNPCVVCNREIKFGLLLDRALKMDSDFVATGHYARRRKRKAQSAKRKDTAKNLKLFGLLSGEDKTKDQSYFLYNLTQEKLAKVLFPIGDYKKSEVYEMAKTWQLPYKKGESVDICFVGKKGHRKFLEKNLGQKKGKIIDMGGKVLGKHQGIWLYTIGQRANVGGPGPFYVVELDIKNNAVIVSNRFREEALYKKSLIAENVNWIAGSKPRMPLRCQARIRYGHATVPAVVSIIKHEASGSENYKAAFKNAQRAITPGQSVVFYKRSEVLGGGIIKS